MSHRHSYPTSALQKARNPKPSHPSPPFLTAPRPPPSAPLPPLTLLTLPAAALAHVPPDALYPPYPPPSYSYVRESDLREACRAIYNAPPPLPRLEPKSITPSPPLRPPPWSVGRNTVIGLDSLELRLRGMRDRAMRSGDGELAFEYVVRRLEEERVKRGETEGDEEGDIGIDIDAAKSAAVVRALKVRSILAGVSKRKRARARGTSSGFLAWEMRRRARRGNARGLSPPPAKRRRMKAENRDGEWRDIEGNVNDEGKYHVNSSPKNRFFES
ncbi:hypothetical protein BDZ91DRAFT_718683, partial [Kalaharituber pfeilii]